MENQRGVVCPDNEGLAHYMRQKMQELADSPRGLSDNTSVTLNKAYLSVCNSKTPIPSLKEFSQVKWVLFPFPANWLRRGPSHHRPSPPHLRPNHHHYSPIINPSNFIQYQGALNSTSWDFTLLLSVVQGCGKMDPGGYERVFREWFASFWTWKREQERYNCSYAQIYPCISPFFPPLSLSWWSLQMV